MTLVIGPQKITLTNVYAPNVQTKQTFQDITGWISNHTAPVHMVCGDFNNVMDTDIDRWKITGGKTQSMKQQDKTNLLRDMTEAHQLVDIWRIHRPEERLYLLFPTAQYYGQDRLLPGHSRVSQVLNPVENRVDGHIGSLPHLGTDPHEQAAGNSEDMALALATYLTMRTLRQS